MARALPVVGQEPYRANQRTGLRHARRAGQLFFLSSWVALFLATREQGAALVPPDLYLTTDPLVALLTMGASQVIVPVLFTSAVFVVFTLVLGRAFCGWICPLGTLIDAAKHVFRPREDRLSTEAHLALQYVKYVVLAIMVVGALCSAQWIYLLDPLVLLFRAAAVGLYPATTALAPDDVLSEGLRQEAHAVAFLPVALLFGVLTLTAVTPRFYCRYLCPLGAFYGLLSRAPLLRRRVTGCDACTGAGTHKQCIAGCRMGAVASNPHKTQNHECIRCLSGRSFCHKEAIHFDWHRPLVPPQKADVEVELSRRTFLLASAAGVTLAPLASLSAYHRGDANVVVRPPRVLDEETFVDQCIRCAMCVQACPTQTLQLLHLEAGVAGFWTPAITPAVGGCIPECDACSVVCPTDAIPEFDKREGDKWSVKMGTVVLEKNRCISFTEDLPCAKCLDICPTKAFVVELAGEATPRRPASVDYVRCVGCGLCEVECRKIVFGAPALVTFAQGRGEPTSLREQPTATFRVPTRSPKG